MSPANVDLLQFMQRAAASKESSQSQPSEGSKTPTPKRPRLSTEAQLSDSVDEPSSDLEAISAALAAEEEKRKEALSRQAAEAGETEWVLEYPGSGNTSQQQPVVIAAGSLDDDDISYGGRQAYGNFKRKKNAVCFICPSALKLVANCWAQNHNKGSHDNESGDEVDPAEVQAMIKKESKEARKPKLSHLTSLSGTRQADIGNDMSQKKRKHK